WTLKSLVCTSSGAGTSTSINGATVSITLTVSGKVDCIYINHINLSPSISTTLSDATVNTGTAVHDSASLTGATANAGGTVTYTVYSDNACTTSFASAGTKTVSNGSVPDSDPVTFNTSGTFYWQAVYSGDANNNGATSVCTSEVLVVKTNPSLSTTLSGTSVAIGSSVHDSATLSGATSDAGGKGTYQGYSANNCSTLC